MHCAYCGGGGGQDQPRHHTPCSDHPLFVFCCTQGRTEPWACCCPLPLQGWEAAQSPDLPAPCLGKQGGNRIIPHCPGHPAEGAQIQGGRPCHRPCLGDPMPRASPLPQGTTGKEDDGFPLSQALLLLSSCFDAHRWQPQPPPTLQPQLLERLLRPSACLCSSCGPPAPCTHASSHAQCHPLSQGPEIAQLHSVAATQHVFLPMRGSVSQTSSGHHVVLSTRLLLQGQLQALLIEGATTVLCLPVWTLSLGDDMRRTPAPQGLSEMLCRY